MSCHAASQGYFAQFVHPGGHNYGKEYTCCNSELSHILFLLSWSFPTPPLPQSPVCKYAEMSPKAHLLWDSCFLTTHRVIVSCSEHLIWATHLAKWPVGQIETGDRLQIRYLQMASWQEIGFRLGIYKWLPVYTSWGRKNVGFRLDI